jgi:hypothetical protein
MDKFGNSLTDPETGTKIDLSEKGNVALMQLALDLNLITEESLSELNAFSEAPFRPTVIKVTKAARLSQFTGRAAVMLARQKGDKLFLQLRKLNKARRTILDKIHKKYSTPAKKHAVMMLRGLQTSDRVSGNDIPETTR